MKKEKELKRKQKYEMHICGCGTIHMVDNETLDRALENDKNLLLICANCGHGIVIGANREFDYDLEEEVFMMYMSDVHFSDKTRKITMNNFKNTENTKGIEEIIYSKGYRVRMETGEYATHYGGGRFFDNSGIHLYMLNNASDSEEILKVFDSYSKNRGVVDMSCFLRETPEEILEEISRYSVSGLNFKGTKWETDWNSH